MPSDRRYSDSRIQELSKEIADMNTSVAVMANEMLNSGKRQEEMLLEIKDLSRRMNGHDKKFAWYSGALTVIVAIWETYKAVFFTPKGH